MKKKKKQHPPLSLHCYSDLPLPPNCLTESTELTDIQISNLT